MVIAGKFSELLIPILTSNKPNKSQTQLKHIWTLIGIHPMPYRSASLSVSVKLTKGQKGNPQAKGQGRSHS